MTWSQNTHRTYATDHMEPGADAPAAGSNGLDMSQSFATLATAERQGAHTVIQNEQVRNIRTADWRVRTGMTTMAQYGKLMTRISAQAGSGLGKGR